MVEARAQQKCSVCNLTSPRQAKILFSLMLSQCDTIVQCFVIALRHNRSMCRFSTMQFGRSFCYRYRYWPIGYSLYTYKDPTLLCSHHELNLENEYQFQPTFGNLFLPCLGDLLLFKQKSFGSNTSIAAKNVNFWSANLDLLQTIMFSASVVRC
jgi:hypothetical protein